MNPDEPPPLIEKGVKKLPEHDARAAQEEGNDQQEETRAGLSHPRGNIPPVSRWHWHGEEPDGDREDRPSGQDHHAESLEETGPEAGEPVLHRVRRGQIV
jgi:hypothetical protein